MSDSIVWYAPELFLAALLVLVIIATVILRHRRARKDDNEFEKVEEL